MLHPPDPCPSRAPGDRPRSRSSRTFQRRWAAGSCVRIPVHPRPERAQRQVLDRGHVHAGGERGLDERLGGVGAVEIATGTTAFDWTVWQTLLTTPAITATQAGTVEIRARLHAEVQEAATGGGERGFLNARIRRTRAATTTDLESAYFYGPRNLNIGGTLTKSGDHVFEIYDTAQVGDVYVLQVQVASQRAATTTFEFGVADNALQIAGLGGSVSDTRIAAGLAAREWDGTAAQFASVTRRAGVTYFVRP